MVKVIKLICIVGILALLVLFVIFTGNGHSTNNNPFDKKVYEEQSIHPAKINNKNQKSEIKSNSTSLDRNSIIRW